MQIYLEMFYNAFTKEGATILERKGAALIKVDFSRPDGSYWIGKGGVHFPCQFFKVTKGNLTNDDLPKGEQWYYVGCYLTDMNDKTLRYGWAIDPHNYPFTIVNCPLDDHLNTKEEVFEWVKKSSIDLNAPDHFEAKEALELIDYLNSLKLS